ncbi:hypothetical protein ABW20_dc0106233 [Dactylellina cionopaga]|nr:hypothetical protein ABW20_dc0106233 [Dactylellina cionopaga]
MASNSIELERTNSASNPEPEQSSPVLENGGLNNNRNLAEDLAIFRRFTRLHAQLLLYRQADIEEIEEELIELDKAEADAARIDGTPANALNRSWRKEKDLEEYRVELIKKLREHMKEYGGFRIFPTFPFARHYNIGGLQGKVVELIEMHCTGYSKLITIIYIIPHIDDELFRYKQKIALKKANEHQIQNVQTWMNNQRPHPLVPTESKFLEDPGDVCALKAGSEDSAVLTDILRRKILDSVGLGSLLFTKGNPASLGNAKVTYYKTEWKDALARVLYASLVSVILVAGVIALFYIESDSGRLACLCVATFLCGVIMALFTTAKKGEIMGATAA